MHLRRLGQWSVRVLLAVSLFEAAGRTQSPTAKNSPEKIDTPAYLKPESLRYDIQWRLINAGTATLTWQPEEADKEKWQAKIQIESAGLVSRLYKIEEHYAAHLEDGLCATSLGLHSSEGKRVRETEVSIDRRRGRATYVERDTVANKVLQSKQTEVPSCVSDVIGALFRLRSYRMEPGQSIMIPMTDGKKSVSAKAEAQEREEVKTSAGTFKTIRYEAYLFNGVLFSKKARLLLWLTDDNRRLPVQIRVKMPLIVGTIDLELQKDQRT